MGQPRVTDTLCAPGVTEEELLCVAASAEKPSEHPLAHAIVEESQARHIPLCPVSGFRSVPGGGSHGRGQGPGSGWTMQCEPLRWLKTTGGSYYGIV